MSIGLAWWGENSGDAARKTVGLYKVPRSVADVIARHIVRKLIPITTDVIAFQQRQADTFLTIGQIPRKLDVSSFVASGV